MPSAAKTTKRRGRRQGEPVSRDAVLSAAKQRFATEGYEKTTLRAIAQDAHVDPSMVLYLFGSKEELFRESLRLIIDPEVLVAALTGAADDDPDIGTRMVRTYLRIWETPDTAASMRVMLQSATSNSDAQDAFRGFMQNYVLTAVSGVLGGGERGPAAGDAGGGHPGRYGDAALHHSGAAAGNAVGRRSGEADRADGDALSGRTRRRAGPS